MTAPTPLRPGVEGEARPAAGPPEVFDLAAPGALWLLALAAFTVTGVVAVWLVALLGPRL